MLIQLMRTSQKPSDFVIAVIAIMTLSLSFNTPKSYARSLSTAAQDHLATTYRELLQTAAVAPPSEVDSIFFVPPPLSEADIEIATQEVRNILATRAFSKAIERLFLLKKIDAHEPLDTNQKAQLLRELIAVQFTSAAKIHDDETLAASSKIHRQTLAFAMLTTGLGIAAAFTPLPVTDTMDTYRDLSWGVMGLAGLSALGIIRSAYLSVQMKPEHYPPSQTWRVQLNGMGPNTDRELYELFSRRRDLDSPNFPTLPYYTALLNRATSQIQDRLPASGAEIAHPPAGTAGEFTAIPITSPPDPTFSIQNQNLKDSDFAQLTADAFCQKVQILAQDIKKRPYSLWSQMLLRRLLFLSLNRKDSRSLYFLMDTSLRNLASLFEGQFEDAFLLGVAQGHLELTQFFLEQSHHPEGLELKARTIRRALKLAEQRNHPEIMQLLTEFAQRPPVENPAPNLTSIHQTASHDRDTERTVHSALSYLQRRYRKKYAEKFANTPSPQPSILSLIGSKIDHLQAIKKLTVLQATAAKGLLARIDEPFDSTTPDYDPTHLFFWNTEDKKKHTHEMLKIAYLALEDEAAFKENTKKTMTPQDCDDNWAAWTLNALYDGEHAYNLDQGRRPDQGKYRPLSSCVAGVDHRIIHGLTGLHPDVKISAGSSEKENLLTWSRAQARFQEEKKAHFFNSVFQELIEEWNKQKMRAKRAPAHYTRTSNAQIVPITSEIQTPSPEDQIHQYQKFVSQRAQALFGAKILLSDELKRVLETIEDNPERIFNSTQDRGAADSSRQMSLTKN